MRYSGKVIRETMGAGSKSEHAGVALDLPGGAVKLRIPGGNPFADPELEALVGCEIECEGEPHQGQLLIKDWALISRGA